MRKKCAPGMDFRGKKLTGANFSGCDLSGSFFDKADLTGANFRNANLTGANFRNANLTDADFRKADVTHMSVIGATLIRTNFMGTINPETMMFIDPYTRPTPSVIQSILRRQGLDTFINNDKIVNNINRRSNIQIVGGAVGGAVMQQLYKRYKHKLPGLSSTQKVEAVSGLLATLAASYIHSKHKAKKDDLIPEIPATEVKRKIKAIKTISEFNQDFRKVKELGKGAFGETELYTSPEGIKVVLKIIPKSKIPLPMVPLLKNEIRILKKLTSKCEESVVCYYNDYESVYNYYIVMEYVNGVPLDDLDKFLKDKKLPKQEMLGYKIMVLQKLCKAVQYVNEKGYVHRDLKPENVMITQDGDVKLIDFGLSCELQNKFFFNIWDWFNYCSLPAGTSDYIAPEAMRLNNKKFAKVDVFSFGVLMYNLLTDKDLMLNVRSIIGQLIQNPLVLNDPITVEDGINRIRKENEKIQSKENLTGLGKQYDDIIKKCITFDEKDRPTMKTICLELDKLK